MILNKSLTEILEENDLAYLLFTHGLEVDPLHLNSVYPASVAIGKAQPGDLLLSLRHMSMLLLYRPSTNRVIWFKSGPWLNQHSAKFDANGDIYLFDNNIIDTHYQRRRETEFYNGNNRLLSYSFSTDQVIEYNLCDVDSSLRTATGGLVSKRNNTVVTTYSNIFTTMVCDLEKGSMAFLLPDTDGFGKTVPQSEVRF